VNKFSVVIATPFYERKAYSPYVVSLLSAIRVLHAAGIPYDYYEISEDSYVDRAKNALIHRFLESDFTHILMIDSDLAWEVEGFGRLLKAAIAGAEVVGGAYPNKNLWDCYGCWPITKDGYVTGKEIDGMRLLEMGGIPGGFIMYSRKAIERARPNLQSYRSRPEEEPVLECFRCKIGNDGIRIGEDIYFQQVYRSCGGKVWLEPDITFQHYGIKGWEGNYDLYLRTSFGGRDYGSLIENLRGVHYGGTAYIVGKGPSLQYLTANDFGAGPVIAINESITHIENLGIPNPIYSMRKDGEDTEHPTGQPRNATLLVHLRESVNLFESYKPRYVFDTVKDFDLAWNSYSSFVAADIAKLLGCRKLIYLAHDACMESRDTTMCIPNEDGTFRIEDRPENKSYLLHRAGIDRHLNQLGVTADWKKPLKVTDVQGVNNDNGG
jgi:hypothetical protein